MNLESGMNNTAKVEAGKNHHLALATDLTWLLQ